MKLELNVNRFANEDVIATSTRLTLNNATSYTGFNLANDSTGDFGAKDTVKWKIGSTNYKYYVVSAGTSYAFVKNYGDYATAAEKVTLPEDTGATGYVLTYAGEDPTTGKDVWQLTGE